MNSVYLIGNGFDLNTGLETKYTDFYPTYSVEHHEDPVHIAEFRKSINNFCVNQDGSAIYWKDAEIGIGQYTHVLSGREDSSRLMIECHKNFCKELSEYLAQESKRFPYSKIANNATRKQILHDLNDVTVGLPHDDEVRLKQYLESFPPGIIVKTISFNYTDILDNIFRQLGDMLRTYSYTYMVSIEPVIHIHGTLSHGFALGVNDETQLDVQTFSSGEPEDKNQLIKPLFLDDMGDGVKNQALRDLNSADLIYIYGMSLGDTDRFWWERITKLMLKKERLRLVYHSLEVPTVGLFIRDYRVYQRQFVKKMLSFVNMGDDSQMSLLSDRIFVSYGNIFQTLYDIVPKT